VCCLLPQNANCGQAKVLANEAPQAEVRLLAVGQIVEGTLADSGSHVYRLNLLRGQFVRFGVSAEDPAANIQVTVAGPDGGKIEELSGPVGQFSLRFISTISGEYHLRVELLASNAPSDKCTVTLEERRETIDQDETRVAASRAMVEAYRLSSQNSSQLKQQADQKFQDARALFRAADDRRGEAEVLQYLSIRSFDGRDFGRSVDYLRQARALWQDLAEYGREAAALESMSKIQIKMGQPQEALDSVNQALALGPAAGEPFSEANALNCLGDVYEAMDQFQEALNSYNRALSRFQIVPNARTADGIESLSALGHVYWELGDPEKELDYLDRALRLARSSGVRHLQVSTLLAVGSAHKWLHEIDVALEYYNKALALTKDDPADEAPVLLSLGEIYLGRGEREKALRYFGKVLDYSHAHHLTELEAETTFSMGFAYKPQPALEAKIKALSMWPYKDRTRRTFLDRIGWFYLEILGDAPKSIEIFEKQVTESRAAKDLQNEAGALRGLAEAERAMQQNTQARRDVEASLKLFESTREQIAGVESRASFFVVPARVYDFYIDLLMQMNAKHPDQGLDAVAFQASERAHARSLLDMLVEAHADFHEGTDPILLEREQTLQQRLRARSEYQVELLERPHTTQQAEIVNRELQSLTAEYDETEAQIRATNSHLAGITQPTPLDLKQIQEQVLDSDTLLLEYSLGKERSYLWAITNSTLTSFTLPKREEIESAARRVYELLTATNSHLRDERELQRETRIAHARSQYPAAVARLSEMLLGPAGALLEHKRLLIVADGALQYIPFAALPMPRSAKTRDSGLPLMVESEIVNAPSASTLAMLSRGSVGRQLASKEVAVLADPVFDSQDQRIPERRPVAQALSQGRVTSQNQDLPIGLERSWSETGGSERGWKIPRLPFSRREADAIVAATPRGKSFEAVDFDATRATLTSPELAQYRVVHFATHAVLDSRTPELSGIILSLVDRRGRPQNGFLRLWDIYNLHLPAELVVLSACQTALGKEVKGEGLIGLTRGFMYAGAARVMASLWQVDDVATAELMSQFYQGFLKKNLPPAAALRAAQVYMWKQKRWRDPYFWASFQIQGRWN